MANTRYRRNPVCAAALATYSRDMAADNARQTDRLKENLLKALCQDVTERQRQYLLLYYCKGLNMRQIGERLGVNKSTVSRTIKRGEARLRRCLRYGAGRLLDGEAAPGEAGHSGGGEEKTGASPGISEAAPQRRHKDMA